LKHAVKFSYPLTRTALLWHSQKHTGLNTGGMNVKGESFAYCLSQFANIFFLITFTLTLFCIAFIIESILQVRTRTCKKNQFIADWNKLAQDKNQWQAL
jgi:hypothetical protein